MKKKKNLLLCLCMAFAFCGTTATLVSCDDDKKPSVNKPVDYEEDGTYYVNVGDVEYTVTLDGGKFALAFGDVAISGDYKYDGETLTLKQGKKVIIPATLVNGVLKLTLNNQDYTLLVKVDYTVSFNVDGTVDEATKQTVLNGKKVAKPASPEKDGYTFVGWYADSSYTVPYTFNETVSNNLTLYARFVKNDATQQEFKITYEVDGEVLATVDTVGGAIYNLPTPAKEGKVFVGWWKSDFDSANKLTAQVKDGVEVKENTTLYAVWQSDAPVVSVTASGATWNAKGVGAQYTLVITAPGAQPQIIPVSTNSYEYDFTKQAAGEYSITVSVNGKSTTVYYNNKGLAKVSNFAVEGSVLTFNKVEGATKYLITVKCGDATHNHVDQDLGDVNAFDFGNCVMPVEGIKFTVKAVANGYVSSVSDEYVVVKNLSAVENLAVSAETDEATWTAVENATEYSVAITYAGKTDTVKVSETKISLKNYGAGEIKVAVVPVAFGYNSAAAVETTYAKARIAAPTALTINGETLEWATVEGATGYIVKVGENTYEATTNSFKFTSDNIPAGVASVEVSVAAKASAEANNSHFSDATKVNFGTMANTLTYKAGKVSWDAVLNVQKYEVQLNDAAPVEVANTKTSADITFTKAGVNTIKVRCYDANGTASDWVEIQVAVYEIHLLGNGGIDKGVLYKAKGDKITLEETTRKGYSFSGWYDAASGGKQYDETFTFNGESTTLIYAGWKANKYKISLYLSSKDTLPYAEVEVVYDQFYVLPVVEDPSGAGLSFTGWFAEENAVGTRYANGNGETESVYKVAGNVNVYGCWGEYLEYEEVLTLEGDYVYQVVAGRDIDKVTEIKVPATFNGKKVARVGGGAFEKCSNLKKIELPDSIEYIEFGDGGYSGAGNAFYYCSGLEGVYIYKTEGTHKRYYESGANGSLIMTDSMTNQKILVFVPKSVTVMTVDDGVEVLGDYVFRNTEIQELTIPASVKEVRAGVFYYCDSLTKLTFLEAKEGEEASLSITSNKNTFYQCSELVDLTLPSHLAKDTDFNTLLDRYPRSLSEIKVNTTAKDGFYAVDGFLCYGQGADATLVYVPAGYVAKDNVLNLTNPDIKKIGAKAFYKSTSALQSIKTINVGQQITSIGESAFEGIQVLKTLNFHATESATTQIDIATKAFYGCSGLNTIALPVNMGTLEEYAFGGIVGLWSVDVSTNMKSMKLAAKAFASTADVFSVTDIKIGKKTPEFEVAAVFGGKITTMTVDAENQSFASADNVLFDKDKTKILYVSATKNNEYTIPNTVKEIGENVFAGRNITKITIPASVTKIGAYAFQNCKYLDEIVFEVAAQGEEAALTVGDYAFEGAIRLTKLTIGDKTGISMPNRTTAIGARAFDSVAIEGALSLPTNLKSLGAGAYANTGITKVVIPEKLTDLPLGTLTDYIGDPEVDMSVFDLFKGCNELAEIEVDAKNANYATVDGVLYRIQKTDTSATATLLFAPTQLMVASDKAEEVNVLNIANKITVNGVDYALTEVASYAFYNLKNIKKVIFADSTGSISFGERAFAYDSYKDVASIEEIKLPVGTTSISRQLFFNLTSLKTVNVPYTASSLEEGAFFNNFSLTAITFDKTPEGKTPVDFVLADSSDAEGYGLSIFYGCQSLTEVNLPERTTKIGEGAFHTGESEVAYGVPDSDHWKFGIQTVRIPANVTEIGSFAFAGYDGYPAIKQVTIAEGSKLETIGSYAFTLSGITQFTIPETVTSVGSYAFQQCYYLESVVCSSQIEKLNNYTFDMCTSLSTVTWGKGKMKLTTIGNGVFRNTAIQSITIPATVTTIKSNAFTTCYDLEEVIFATYEKDGKQVSDLETLEQLVFAYCPSLTSIVFPETVGTLTFSTSSTPLFRACSSLKSVTLPSTVESIDNVFTECGGLEEIIISSENKNLDLSGAMVTNLNGTAIRYCYAPVAGDTEGTYTIANTVTELSAYAFKGMTGIKKLVIPNTVGKIGTNAFQGMLDLEEVVFEAGNDTLKSLPNYLFADCVNLKKVTLPDQMTKFGTYTFSNCVSLTGVEIPATVTALGGYMFKGSGLTKITLPASLEFTAAVTGTSAMGTNAFIEATALEEVTVLGNFDKIPQKFFQKCASLKKVNGLDKTTYVGKNAFEGCVSLTSLDLPKVTNIDTYAFDGCTGLKSVALGEDLVQLGNKTNAKTASYVFRNCSSLTEITIPEGITFLCSNNFVGCTNLKKVTFEGTLTEVGSNAFANCSLLKEVVGIENVTNFYAQAFMNCTSLVSIDISKASTFQYGLFNGCTNLESVKLNENVTSIPYSTFQNCTSLKSIELPAGLTEIQGGSLAVKAGKAPKADVGAFQGSGITEIKVPAGVTFIDQDLFKGCSELVSVVFVGNVSEIKANAFYGCEKLAAVDVGSVVTKIGDAAFYGCAALEVMDLPDTLTSLGTNAFRASGIGSVNLSSSLSEIGAGAFFECENLVSANVLVAPGGILVRGEDGIIRDAAGQLVWAPADVQIAGGTLTVTADMKFSGSPFSGNATITRIVVEAGVTEISAEMFRAIPNVTEVVLPEGIVSIGDYAFADCAKLENINVPSTVKTIGEYAFAYTGALVVDMTNATNLETIGEYAFNGSGIQTIVIPANVTELSNGVFENATNLESLALLGQIKKLGTNAFANTKITVFDASNLEVVAEGAFHYSSIIRVDFGKNLRSLADKVFGVGVLSSEDPLAAAKVQIVTFADDGKLTDLGDSYTFARCTDLKEVKLPNTLRHMGLGAFEDCTALDTVTIPDGLEFLGWNYEGASYDTGADGTFSGCTSLKQITLPSTLKYISGGAFTGCINLESIDIPESVVLIGDEAFKDCVKLKEIVLPEGLYIIGEAAFAGCTSLKSVTIAKGVYIKANVFDGWTAEQTVNFVGTKYSVVFYNGAVLNGSNANVVFEYKESAGE